MFIVIVIAAFQAKSISLFFR